MTGGRSEAMDADLRRQGTRRGEEADRRGRAVSDEDDGLAPPDEDEDQPGLPDEGKLAKRSDPSVKAR